MPTCVASPLGLAVCVRACVSSRRGVCVWHVVTECHEQLKDLGVPVQERKRLLNFLDKYKQGYRHDGREGPHAWKGWRAPYRQAGHPSNEPGQQPYRGLKPVDSQS